MSHFSVVVIGEDHEGQLAPYHEFECTGRVDQFVQSLDVTDEIRAEFDSGTRRMMVLPDGKVISAYDPIFYREPTAEEKARIGPIAGTGGGNGMSWASNDWGDGKGYCTRVLDLTLVEGAEEKDLPYSEVMTFMEYLTDYSGERPVITPGQEPDLEGEHQWGWVEVDADGEVAQVIRRTNPNSKWDFFMVGGRWTGYFPLRDGTTGQTGKPGLMTPTPSDRTADQCAWGDVDLAAARSEAEGNAADQFDLWEKCFRKQEAESGTRPLAFQEAIAKFDGDYGKGRPFYRDQPAIADLNERLKLRGHHVYLGCPVSDFGFDRDAYLALRRSKALVPFAVVKDGVWYERGEMGFFASVSGEMDEAEWIAQVAKLYEELPEDTIVTMVDCHV